MPAATSTAPPTTLPAPTTAAPATTAAATTPPPTEPPATAVPAIGQCATAALTLTLGDTDGAMGSRFTPLIFTNTGSTTCTLDGHPGVSFVDATGTQIGPSAERTDATTPTVALAPGEQANALMQWHAGDIFGDECAPVSADRMKVYPPDQTEAIIVAFDIDVCTGAISEAQATIGVVNPGTNP